MAAGGDMPPLVEGDGAEIAGAEAPPVMGEGKLHLFYGGHAALLFVAGVIPPFIGQLRHRIQLRRFQRQRRRGLHQVLLPVLLHDGPPRHMVLLLQLQAAGTGMGLFILRNLIEGGAGNGIFGQRGGKGAKITGPPDIPHPGGMLPPFHAVGYFGDGMLPHAVNQQIRAAFRQNGGPHGVIPVVVVGKPPQRCLQPADDDGNIAVGLPDEPAIDDGRTVGAQPCPAAGGIKILAAQTAGGGIVGNHRVNIPAGNQKTQPGPPEALHLLRGIKAGLRQHRHPVAQAFQQPCDDGSTKARVVHIGIPRDIDKVRSLPAAGRHFFFCDGQKAHSRSPLIFSVRSGCPR